MDEQSDLVTLHRDGPVAVITLNRPRVHNAQNGALIYALDDAYRQFANEDGLRVAILRGTGKSFSAGHDLGPGADRDVSFSRWTLWWDHVGKQGAENRLAREEELYLQMCRRWRELPKPTIAMVHGACIAGGLMLAWSCDLVTAAESAFFADPTVAMGLPGNEFFVHPWVMGPRQAKEFLFTGRRISGPEALTLGMVNHVFPDDQLEAGTHDLARRIAKMPRMGLALAKMAVNQAEDAMGQRVGIDSTFGLHQLAHAHNAETAGDALQVRDPAALKHIMSGSAAVAPGSKLVNPSLRGVNGVNQGRSAWPCTLREGRPRGLHHAGSSREAERT